MRTVYRLALPAVLLAACGLHADTVEMKDTGLKLEGKVHRETEDFIILLVDGDKGQIRIPKDKIKSITYDINTQLEKLKTDDFASRYKVALWAMERGMFADAIPVLKECIGKEGVGQDLLKQLGTCYEQRQQLDLALKTFKDYLVAHADDKTLSDHVQELQKQVGPEETATGPKAVQNGMEGDGVWMNDNDKSFVPCKAQVVDDAQTHNKVVVVQSPGGNQDKAAFSRTGQPLNLTESKEMVFRVFLDSPAPMMLAMGFVAGGEWHETKQQRIAPNSWIDMSFKIDGKQFKTEKTNWKFESDLGSKDRVTRLIFLVYKPERQFTLYVDNVYFK